MHKLLHLLMPTRVELVGYPILATVILVLAAISSIFEAFAGEGFGGQLSDVWSETFEIFFDKLSSFDFSAQASLIIFWSVVGVVIYVVAVIAHNMWVEARNDIVVEKNFLHPRHYKFDGFWAGLAIRGFFRLSIFVILVILTFATANLLMPLWVNMFELWIDQTSSPRNWGGMLLSILGLSGNIHVFVILLRLFLLRTRVFHDGET